MLLDSNIIIYSSQPQYTSLRDLIEEQTAKVSVVSYIEVLGFHRITLSEKTFLQQFFDSAEILSLTDPIATRAIRLRQFRRMSLGDSIIAATAIEHNLTLITHNTADYRWIRELAIHNPLS